MWHALRAELAYSRTTLLAAWSIAIGVAVFINLLALIGDHETHPAAVAATLPALFLIISAMVVGFITQGQRSEERRHRLLLMGQLTPRQLGLVMVLLPASLVGAGIVASCVVVVLVSLISGQLEHVPLHMVSSIGTQMFAIVQLGLLAQESTAARRQHRTCASVAGWTAFVLVILLLAGLQTALSSIPAAAGHLLLAALTMAFSSELCASRKDFTR